MRPIRTTDDIGHKLAEYRSTRETSSSESNYTPRILGDRMTVSSPNSLWHGKTGIIYAFRGGEDLVSTTIGLAFRLWLDDDLAELVWFAPNELIPAED